MALYINDDKKSIITIYNDFIYLHGIKPSGKELILEDDSYELMIHKFDIWYKRALDYARGDSRDEQAFYSIVRTFQNTIYIKFKDTEKIVNNIFIQNMLFKLNISGGKKYVYPDLIINISNPTFNEDIVELEIHNINFEYIDNITISRYACINDLYQLIFNKLKDKLVKLEQLKILYNNKFLDKTGSYINKYIIFDIFNSAFPYKLYI